VEKTSKEGKEQGRDGSNEEGKEKIGVYYQREAEANQRPEEAVAKRIKT
jgi:hypothetical protein